MTAPAGRPGPVLETRVYRIPLRTRFRGIDVRDGVLVRGPAGWGEFSPFWDYDVAESRRWWSAAEEAAFSGWPAPVRDAVPVNVTVPAVGPQQAHAIVSASGCRTAKVKVAEAGQTPADDLARVEAVRDALGPAGAIRVDANAAWDVVVLKVQPLAGVRAALRVAEAHGLPCVVSSALESSVGIAAGVALAAALPELPFACGLATVALFTADVTSEPLLPVDGALPVTRPVPDRLAEATADAGTGQRWQDRLTAVLAG